MTVALNTESHPTRRPFPHNPLGVRGIEYIEFHVDDVEAWAQYHEQRLGMRRRAQGDVCTGLAGRRAVVVGQGRINLLFAQAEGDSPEAQALRDHVQTHGNGVKDIAFRVVDASVAIQRAQSAGARVVRPVQNQGFFASGAIAAYGDTTHTFVQRTAAGPFAPGYVDVPGGIETGDIQLMMIDHVVANVEHMDEWVEFYGRIFGFEQTAHFDIKTGRSALMSKVVGDSEGYIKLPINEPSSRNSQIQEFLDEFHGPGVQHIAMLTPDIVDTVREMRRGGMQFLGVPGTYFDALPQRVGEIRENMDALRELGILVDRDRPDGYLLQLFSKPIFDRPTLFYEIIQRRGNSEGFGEGNFRALFEAIEREQQHRGTL